MIGMFLPSFFTGEVVRAIGKMHTMLLIFMLLLTGACIFYNDHSKVSFTCGIAVVGIGWNFSFVPATALLTTLYRPNERSRVLTANDFVVIGVLACLMASAGSIYVRLQNNLILNMMPE
jgi:MFS family permease